MKAIAIAGGGIGGLACALALARRGLHSVVLEQARELGEAGVGLQVAPNALRVLDALGVGAAATRHALLIERIRMMDAVTGEPIVDIPCGEAFIRRFGNPYAVAHRADIHGALLDACRASGLVELRTSARVCAFDDSGSHVQVELEAGGAVHASALVGADGVHSVVRKQLLDDGDPLPAGAIIYRAVIPAADMPRELQHPWPTLWAGPGTHIIYYPLRDWSTFNFGATLVSARTDFADGSEASLEEALPLFGASCEMPLRALRAARRFRRYIIRHRRPVESWTVGRVTLLGDAAHAMVQYIAQGAAQALEDAQALAEALAASPTEPGEAFKRYQEARIVRASRVQVSSLMMHHLIHAGGIERQVRNSLFAGRSAEQHYERLDWLYGPGRDYTRQVPQGAFP
ncbi:MAG TPA: FAD-dependent monooxygenase [Burkholderiales bacterium]|nr:FAD-dependent monooxygenase [Burkholderiales bacterium]